MFYGWLFLQTLLISLFAPRCPFKHLRVFITFFLFCFLCLIMTKMYFIFLTLLTSDLWCVHKNMSGRAEVVVAVGREAHQTQWEHHTAKPTSPLLKSEC